jgi:hypothetical protein
VERLIGKAWGLPCRFRFSAVMGLAVNALAEKVYQKCVGELWAGCAVSSVFGGFSRSHALKMKMPARA